MCCPLLIIAFFGPRTALVYLWFIGYLNGVFSAPLWPILGFFFLPITTLVYAVIMHNGGMTDLARIILVVAALFDLGIIGGAARERRGRTS